MNKTEYNQYEKAVQEFFESEGITNLTQISDSDGYCEPSFSSWPCDCCGTTLGGDRYNADGYNPKTKEVAEYEVCPDCIYYSEYGQLDDDTMLDIEED